MKISFRSASYFLIAGWLLYAICYVLFGEKVPAGEGFGWDGTVYGNAARDLVSMLREHTVTNTRLERLLPSALAWCFFNLSGISSTNAHIILFFEWMNLVLIAGSSFLWLLIAREANLSDPLQFLGLIALICSFPILKGIPYYPVLTDAAGLFLGFLVLYGFLAKKTVLLIGAMVCGAYTWPMAALVIPLLVVFPRSTRLVTAKAPRSSIVMFILGLFALDLLIYYFFIVSGNLSYDLPAYRFRAPKVHDELNLLAGALCLDAYLFLCFRYLTTYPLLPNIKIAFGSIRYWLAGLCLCILFLSKWIGSQFPVAQEIKFSWYLIDMFVSTALQPLGNLVNHIGYYGPVLFLVLFGWSKVIRYFDALGAGCILFFTANMVQCLDSESRHLLFFFPFLILGACITLGQTRITTSFTVVFALLSLAFSKVWIYFNTPEFVKAAVSRAEIVPEEHQRFFMNNGGFITYPNYLIYLVIVVIAGVMIYQLKSRLKKV